jgi:hypothetical protein
MEGKKKVFETLFRKAEIVEMCVKAVTGMQFNFYYKGSNKSTIARLILFIPENLESIKKTSNLIKDFLKCEIKEGFSLRVNKKDARILITFTNKNAIEWLIEKMLEIIKVTDSLSSGQSDKISVSYPNKVFVELVFEFTLSLKVDNLLIGIVMDGYFEEYFNFSDKIINKIEEVLNSIGNQKFKKKLSYLFQKATNFEI